MIDDWGISHEISPILISLEFTDDQSTLVQVMAWFHQATSHYLSQCLPISLLLYGVTWPEWVNSFQTYVKDLEHWSRETALMWLSQDLTDDESTLAQVMAWCHKATSHDLNQCWQTSTTPTGVTRSQWVYLSTCWSVWKTHACISDLHYFI